jgi:ZIP family zinc transporter
MLILMLHNFPEGIITFLSSIYNIKLGIKLSIAIAIHNIPEGISIAIPIYYATKSRYQALKMTLISSIAEPLGAILAYFVIAKYINQNILGIILIFVAFLMINLSIEEIYPRIDKKEGREAFIGMMWGILVILLNIII